MTTAQHPIPFGSRRPPALRAARAPRLRLPVRQPTRRERGVGLGVALAVTGLAAGALADGLSASRWMDTLRGRAPAAAAAPVERLVYVTPAAAAVAEPARTAVPPSPRAAAPPAARAAAPTPSAAAARSVEAGSGLRAPISAPPADSTLAAPAVGAGAFRPAGDPRLHPPATGAGGGLGAGGCVGPCTAGTATGARGNGSGLSAPAVPLDSAVAGILAPAVRAGPSRPAGQIQVGLPGGGPTRAQRERAAALHAGNMERLARLQAHFDSVRADSIRRDSLRRAEAARRRPPR